MGTAQVSYGSDLQRKTWLKERMLEARAQSLWAPYTGSSSASIVYQANNANAKAGHTIVFDYTGNITVKAIKGKDTAYGKGVTKRKFSDKITVDRYRFPVNNGDAFDGVDIDDLMITEHSDSVTKLMDQWIRWKDQALFDAAQGALGDAATHVYKVSTDLSIADLRGIEKAIRTSSGFVLGGAKSTTSSTKRRPLEPYRLQNGEPVWLFRVDSYMADSLKGETSYVSIVSNADVRGADNRLISGVIGKIGRLLIIEDPQFYGETTGSGASFSLEDSEVEMAGLRLFNCTTGSTITNWEGMTGFTTATAANVFSRGLVLGAGALQFGMGKQPDYKVQESPDFAIDSESAMEVWCAVKKTILTLESGKAGTAKIDELDYGVICVDMAHG